MGTEKDKKGLKASRDLPPARSSPFSSNDEVLHAARQVLRWRAAASGLDDEPGQDDVTPAQARKCASAWTRVWHGSIRLTGTSIPLVKRMKDARLDRFGREAAITLVLNQLGLVQPSITNPVDLLRVLGITGFDCVSALRALSEDGRLAKAGLILYSDEDEELRDRAIFPDPALVEVVLQEQGRIRRGWPVRSEAELLGRLGRLTRAFRNKVNAIEGLEAGYGDMLEFHKTARVVDKLRDGFDETLAMRPSWKLSKFFREDNPVYPIARAMLLALLGKEQGHLHADDDLFKGLGLARAAAPTLHAVHHALESLRPGGILIEQGLVRPSAGSSELLDADTQSIAETEFELSDKAIEMMGVNRMVIKSRRDGTTVRQPVVSLSNLVLGDRVRRALCMAAAQARNAGRLIDDWGLGEVIPYGRTVTLLFSGPPGTGKTACAEAIAKELGKPILVADYAKIQNCFVGQTEKNITRTFREAKYSGAVLFWDEADAMFYDRDDASRTWEVRDVNVLLQELERFDGVCVLATNRKIRLDKALERRISLKVEFERPDRAMRRSIWEKMLPKKLPLAADVDLDELSRQDLSGGEIKNAVLNAARFAVMRDPEGPVTMGDFNEALRFESDGGWTAEAGTPIGFKTGDGR